MKHFFKIIAISFIMFGCSGKFDKTQTSDNLIINALDRYKHDQGVFPEKLQDIVPSYLGEVPKSAYNDREFIYEKSSDSYQLIYLGAFGVEATYVNHNMPVSLHQIMHKAFQGSLGADFNWRNGMGMYDDWSLSGGSQMYRDALAAGAIQIGNQQFIFSSKNGGGTYTLATKAGRLGYYVDANSSEENAVFTDARILYMTVAHELVHARDILNGNRDAWMGWYEESATRSIMEHHAYLRSVEIEKSLVFSTGADFGLMLNPYEFDPSLYKW